MSYKGPYRRLGAFYDTVVMLGAGLLLSGCVTKPVTTPDALTIASCPPLGPVSLVTPADSWRALVDDAERYNTCRCAALRNTSQACKITTPTP